MGRPAIATVLGDSDRDQAPPAPPPAAGFEAVIAIGLLHHLDDAEAARLVRIAASALTPAGRLVTVDPAPSADQPRLARWLIERDRGRNVREPGAIEGLASPAFAEVAVSTRHDLARVPYTHAILEARQPRRGGE